MIYLKKVINQDIERTPTFNIEAIHNFFNIDIQHGATITKRIRLSQCNVEFDIEFKHRATRNEYRIFLRELFKRINPSAGDILIFSKINDILFECEYIGQSNPMYTDLENNYLQNKNHQLLNSI